LYKYFQKKNVLHFFFFQEFLKQNFFFLKKNICYSMDYFSPIFFWRPISRSKLITGE